MKLSKLIEKLQSVHQDHGDMDVAAWKDENLDTFAITKIEIVECAGTKEVSIVIEESRFFGDDDVPLEFHSV